MGLGQTWSVALIGLVGHPVQVETHVQSGLPHFGLVGLPDASLGEAKERVRAAVASSGLAWPASRVTVNLSPADLPKSGSGFDLAIAVASLLAAGRIDGDVARDRVHLGELGLDGRIHPVRGILPSVAAAVAAGHAQVVVPQANADEARLVPGAVVHAAAHLAHLAGTYGADIPRLLTVPAAPVSRPNAVSAPRSGAVKDLADVLGQSEARRGLEVAAAGGHHLYLVGPPGTGKTMLASRLPGLLPDLTEAEALEVTSVHSVAGTFDAAGGLLVRPPFEDPHHTATPASVVGGGSGLPRPGAASRAHRGVLFLDEAPEFSVRVLETLRQPLEEGQLVIHRARGVARFPARFQLVLAANPCPCGKSVGKGLDCTCTPMAKRRYGARLSGPLRDRIDIRLEVPQVTRAELNAAGPPESTAVVAARVRAARERQRERLAGTGWVTNAEVPGSWLRDRTRRVEPAVTVLLDAELDRGRLSLRGLDRVLRVAWTLADLAERDRPTSTDVGEALGLRMVGTHA
ncbi:ATP-binding protein [Occultella glacieicola]|uniref:ATP-binding protein n=1 Tax=Occultella glacieicola TaxID=2518684 RepID=A0ABY2DWN7_9MICO|nr:YifB family Mg chelatase-like AAA ATPase [Occultella glacieicola]TDE88282.1 ATP-binding protein [Occultella glacieicola]